MSPADPNDHTKYFTLLGRHDITDHDETNWMNRTISAISRHSSYNSSAKVFKSTGDIAVFRMSQKVDFTDHIQPVCLPHSGTSTGSVFGYVVGHGVSDDWLVEDVPKEAKMNSISGFDCVFMHKDHNNGVSPSSFCASSPNASPCNGDSGGGFYVFDNRTMRVASYGVVSQRINTGECRARDVAVFVSVPEFIEWIYKGETLVVINFDEKPIILIFFSLF
jgi:secreted trypsin-like serine protease